MNRKLPQDARGTRSSQDTSEIRDEELGLWQSNIYGTESENVSYTCSRWGLPNARSQLSRWEAGLPPHQHALRLRSKHVDGFASAFTVSCQRALVQKFQEPRGLLSASIL